MKPIPVLATALLLATPAFAEGELLSLGYALEQVLPGVGAAKL